jgi:hypothetical protein
MWAAASPGAGFVESAQYLKIKTAGDAAPPWWEQKLWHYYDAVDYAANLFNLPTIEYHGEIDPQQQAGDLMARAMAEEGMPWSAWWARRPRTNSTPIPKSSWNGCWMRSPLAAATPPRAKSASPPTPSRTTSPAG